jgi:endonuclease/exonuclease/phosphatase family metal-dependent hydrolase
MVLFFTPVNGQSDRDGNSPEIQNLVNNRMWSVDVLVNPGFSFMLTGVHLKAGRSDRDIAMRKGQIEFLKGQFERFTKEYKKTPIMVLGDFNCTPESDEFGLLMSGKKNQRLIDPIADPMVFSHPADNPRWRIDHILVNKEMEKLLVPGSVKVLGDLFEKESMRKASDHLPLIAEISIK